ncbi:MAG: glycosyltransferase [Deltaproteobacteria bacterium]|jgi:glycosyltransferase involved in cell wall biosynthesis|nr:glycosyltransferase [Deltaproteobacteria bacterium]
MAQPRVSVIIPVHGTEQQFPACMESVLAQRLTDIEIICVDDASPDACGRLMDEYARRDARVRALHQEHGGVSVARNAGLAAARGQYVYFLDSDDQISPDFLESFFHAANRERADVVLFEGMFLGQRPEEVAYATTWTVFLRKSLLRWPELRFPPGVQPAEDSVFTHLCFALAGRICIDGKGTYIYVHHPGQNHWKTPPRSTDIVNQLPLILAALKRAYDRHKLWQRNFAALCRLLQDILYRDLSVLVEHSLENRQRYAGMMRELLRPVRPLLTQHVRTTLSPGLLEWFEDAKEARATAKSLPRQVPRVLVIDILPPDYDRHAGGRATWQSTLQLKAAGCHVAFTCLHQREGATRYFAELRAQDVDVIEPGRHQGNVEDWLRASAASFDLVLLHRPAVAARLLGLIQEECKKPVMYFGHDLLFLRQEREAAAGGHPLPANAARQKEQELAAYRTATIAMSPSQAEAALLLEQYAVPGPVFVPQLLSYPTPDLGPLDRSQRKGLLFVGSAAHTANLDGLRWFLSGVYPLLTRHIPDCPLHIAGFGMRPELFAALPASCMLYDGIPDKELTALYNGSLVCIAPLRFGAGMKGKLLEAMFHGLPLVGTSVAYEGLPELPAPPADTEESFADACAALLRNASLWQEAGIRSRSVIAKRFSEAKAVRFWRDMVELALRQPRFT